MEGDGQRGARIIQLKQGERNFETWIRLDDGTVYEAAKNQQKNDPERIFKIVPGHIHVFGNLNLLVTYVKNLCVIFTHTLFIL